VGWISHSQDAASARRCVGASCLCRLLVYSTSLQAKHAAPGRPAIPTMQIRANRNVYLHPGGREFQVMDRVNTILLWHRCRSWTMPAWRSRAAPSTCSWEPTAAASPHCCGSSRACSSQTQALSKVGAAAGSVGFVSLLRCLQKSCLQYCGVRQDIFWLGSRCIDGRAEVTRAEMLRFERTPICAACSGRPLRLCVPEP
jgi:hypothetical protein